MKRKLEVTLINNGEDDERKPTQFDTVERVAKVISAIALPLIVGVGGWLIQDSLSQRQTNQEYVELAISIVSSSDDETPQELRSWAVKLLSSSSPIPIDDSVQIKLVRGQILFPGATEYKSMTDAIFAFREAGSRIAQSISRHSNTVSTAQHSRRIQDLRDTVNPCELVWVKIRAEDGVLPTDCAIIAAKALTENRISLSGLESRLLFDVLTGYAELLSAMAASNSSVGWADATVKIRRAANTFMSMNNMGSTRNISELAKNLRSEQGPLNRILVISSEEGVYKNQQGALEALRSRYHPNILSIIELLREDLQVVAAADGIFTGQLMNDIIFEYADGVHTALNDQGHLTSQRVVAISRLEELVEINSGKSESLFVLGLFDAALDAFEDASRSLLVYALSMRQPEDFRAVSAAVWRYSIASEQVLQAIEK